MATTPSTPQDWRGWLQDGAQRVHLVRLDAQERVLAATRLQQAGLLDALFARAAEPLNFSVQVGAAASAGRLWAPTARKVEVCLYPGATAAPAQRFAAEWEPASGSFIMDEVALYNYPLSAARVAAHYAGGALPGPKNTTLSTGPSAA